MILLLESSVFYGFTISVDMNKQLCFCGSCNKALQKIDNIAQILVKQLNKGYSIVNCLLSVNQRLNGLYNYYGVVGNEFWLQYLYENTVNRIKDILYFDTTTRQMTLDALLTLLELCPIAIPPASLISL